MKPNTNTQSAAVYQELKYLREKVANLTTAQKPVAATSSANTNINTKVEYKVDSKLLGTKIALVKLLTANENFFGPEAGVEKPKPSKELREAMAEAAKLVKVERKP